jgi:hypothetical protein
VASTKEEGQQTIFLHVNHFLLHDCSVLDGKTSEPLPVSNSVKQGCVLAATLLSTCIPCRYITNGKFFNLRRLQAKTKIQKDEANDFLFANDCALNAELQTAMQHSMDQFSGSCDNFGLTTVSRRLRGYTNHLWGNPASNLLSTSKARNLLPSAPSLAAVGTI